MNTNTDYQESSRIKLETALQEIDDLKEQLQQAKDALPVKALALLNNAPTSDEANALAWAMYWDYEAIPTTVLTEFYKAHILRVLSIIGGAYIEAPCKVCGKTELSEFNSRTSYREATQGKRADFICGECKDKGAKSHLIWAAENEKRQEEKRRIIDALCAMPYKEYLQTAHWKDLRRRMLVRAHFSCQLCSANKVELHVHHRTYANRGNEQYGDLIVLCANCHAKFHDKLENDNGQ